MKNLGDVEERCASLSCCRFPSCLHSVVMCVVMIGKHVDASIAMLIVLLYDDTVNDCTYVAYGKQPGSSTGSLTAICWSEGRSVSLLDTLHFRLSARYVCALQIIYVKSTEEV
ncbi:hypothetical protein ATANTOWER_021186 [Ataeniobius toweri]|uniref:Uncharacterized protein n=1 Tax=Ataeniobius toweri TaxID=208326 RepID=A0ABU7BGV2_9TELE|nr:hypothetical protein [Ataeniobius toweri]